MHFRYRSEYKISISAVSFLLLTRLQDFIRDTFSASIHNIIE